MKNIKKMTKKKQSKKKKDEFYPENDYTYNDTGYNNLYLIEVDTTFDNDYIYTIILD